MSDDSNSQTLIETAFQVWRRRKWLIIISFVSVVLMAVGLIMALPDLYRSSSTLIVGQDDVAESLVEHNVSTELELRLGIIRQALMSRRQLQDVIDEFNLYEKMRQTEPPASVIDRMRKDIDFEQEAYAQPQWGQSATFEVTISYQAWDPELAALVANDLARRFQEENERRRSTQATRATDIVREQLDEAREKFQAQEQLITDFRNDNMGNLPEQQEVNLTTLARLNSELVLNGERQMQLTDQQDAALKAAASSNTPTNGSPVTARMRLERLRQELDQLRGTYTDSHPEIIRVEREIQTLSLELSDPASAANTPGSDTTMDSFPAQADRDMARLKDEERRLQAAISSLTRRIEGVPRIEQQLKRLTYDYDTAREEYLSMQRRYRDVVLAQSLETEKSQEVKVVEIAIPPDYPSAPDKMQLLFVGLILAGGFSAGILLLVEQFNKTFHSTRELRRFTRIPVIANIGHIKTSRDRWMGRLRFCLNTVIVAIGIFLLAAASHRMGQGAEQLVLAIAG